MTEAAETGQSVLNSYAEAFSLKTWSEQALVADVLTNLFHARRGDPNIDFDLSDIRARFESRKVPSSVHALSNIGRRSRTSAPRPVLSDSDNAARGQFAVDAYVSALSLDADRRNAAYLVDALMCLAEHSGWDFNGALKAANQAYTQEVRQLLVTRPLNSIELLEVDDLKETVPWAVHNLTALTRELRLQTQRSTRSHGPRDGWMASSEHAVRTMEENVADARASVSRAWNALRDIDPDAAENLAAIVAPHFPNDPTFDVTPTMELGHLS